MMKRIQKTIVGFAEIVGFLALVGVLMSLLARWHYLFDMATHFRLQVCVALLVSGLCLLLLGRKYRYGTVVLVVGIALLITLAVFFIPANKGGKVVSELRVLSLNVLTSNQSKDKVVDYIKAENPEIIIVSEIDRKWEVALDKAFRGTHPHVKTLTSFDNFGIGVYSQIPFDPGSQILRHGDYRIAYLDLMFTKKLPFRILGIHPVPPSSSGYWKARNQQMNDVAKLLSEKPELATIVCGDLNCSPWSPFYRDMLKVGKLTNAAAGFGIRPTWTAFSYPLGIPIDHVLISKKVQVLDHRVGPNVGSDHRGITVDVAL